MNRLRRLIGRLFTRKRPKAKQDSSIYPMF